MFYIVNVFTGGCGHFIQSLVAQCICQDSNGLFDYGDVAHSHEYVDLYRQQNFESFAHGDPVDWSRLRPRATDRNRSRWVVVAPVDMDYDEFRRDIGPFRRLFVGVSDRYRYWQAANHLVKNREIPRNQELSMYSVKAYLENSQMHQTLVESSIKDAELARNCQSWHINFGQVYQDPELVIRTLEDYLAEQIMPVGLENYRRYLAANLDLIQRRIPWLQLTNNADKVIKDSIAVLDSMIAGRS